MISPEGCASILYRDAGQAAQAAEALKLTSSDLLELGVIDGIIPEPSGGAHNDFDLIAERVKQRILESLSNLSQVSTEQLIAARHRKYEKLGFWLET